MGQAVLAFLRFLLGVLLIPACIVATRVLMGLFTFLAEQTGDALLPVPLAAFCVGFILWLLVYFLMPRPIRSYVLAHELTHAIWGLVMGARVSKLKIRQDGGSVTLSKSNIWITLAPYFFPFYSVLLVILYLGLSCFWDVARVHFVWLGLLGLSWSFHCTFTASSLLQHQTDVQAYGYVLSYTLIYFLNAVAVGLGVMGVSALTLEQFIAQCVAEYGWTCNVLDMLYRVSSEWVLVGLHRLQ